MRRQTLFILILVSLFCFIQYASDVKAQDMPSVNLNLIPTSDTLGKGGYSFSTGMYPYSINKRTAKPMEIDVGGFFKEMHDARIESDIWLVPTRITYGISDRLDFAFGGTYSMGNTEKSIKDYYEIGDQTKERVYSQMVLDGMMGMKYNLQKATINMPALTLGTEAYLGYTVDDELVDKTLSDSFPFVAMQIYIAGSYDFKVANLHGGAGMYVSSKSVQTNKRFNIPIQVGVEIPFGSFSVVIDYATFKAFSGIGLESVISGGLRYNISSRAMLNASFASVGGFTIGLTVGGKNAQTAVTQPSSAPSLF
jgi:hypothetical protein